MTNELLYCPALIIFEGPAGAGKTTLMRLLHNQISKQHIAVAIANEFSDNAFGRLIAENAQYGKPKPRWLKGLNGLLIFLADKIGEVKRILEQPDKVWLCDRFFDSQFMLGFEGKGKVTEEERSAGEALIAQVNSLYTAQLPADTVFVYLEADMAILNKRLEERMGRTLTINETAVLINQVNQYKLHYSTVASGNTLIVNSAGSSLDTLNSIISAFNEKA